MSGIDPRKILTPVAAFLVVFTGLVSGGTYHWAASVFGFGAILLFLLAIGIQSPSWKPLWPMFPFLAVVYLSSSWTINLNNTITQAFYLTTLVFFAFAVAQVTAGGRRQLLVILYWTGCAVALYAVYQYFIGFSHTEKFLQEYGASSGLTAAQIEGAQANLRYRRAFSTLFSPNILACYLAMVLPVGLDLCIGQSSRRGRLVYGALSGVMTLALFLSKSVGGFVALAGGILIYAVIKVRGRVFAGRTAAAMLAAVVMLSLLGAGIFYKRSDKSFFGAGKSLSMRSDYWRSALEISAGSPVIGKGAGSFEIIYPRYKRAGADEVRYAHNLFLQVLSETGVLGAGSLLLFVSLFFYRCVSGLKSDVDGLTPGIIAGGAAFMVHNMTDFSFFIPETAVVFFMYCGLAYSKDKDNKLKRVPSIAIKTAALVSVSLFALFFTKGWLAASSMDEALAVLAENGITSKAAARSQTPPPQAVELAEKIIGLAPFDDRAHAFLAGLYEGQASAFGGQQADRAITEYRAAISLNPEYPFNYSDLGLLYLKLGDRGKAQENFRAALVRYPTSPELAKYLKLAGNK